MKANILVIDDEESIRFAFENFLSNEGHSVFGNIMLLSFAEYFGFEGCY